MMRYFSWFNWIFIGVLLGKVFPIHAQSQMTKFSLHLENRTIEYVLAQIEQQTHYRFVYSSNQIDKNRPVALHIQDKTVFEVLPLLFDTSAVTFNHIDNQIVIKNRNWRRAAYGTLSGQVKDQLTEQPLPGAAIVLKGTTQGAASDLSGNFTLTLVPEGEQTLVVSYLGYETMEKTVTVTANQATRIAAIELIPNLEILGEVIVKASLEGQNRALNQQRTADNIKNIISADVMSRFPDMDASESLQRVPGINITRSRGQGGQISIRGTPTNFTTVSINGEQIQGTERDGGLVQRSESLDLIPADQLSSIEVSKALTPDQDADAVGGSVNLISPTARSLKSKGKVEAGAGYNDLSGKLNFIGKFTVGQRFFANDRVDDGRLGILLGGSYFGTDNGLHRVENTVGWRERTAGGRSFFTPDDYRFRDLRNQRRRTGFTATVDWRFSPTSKIFANLVYSRLFDDDEQDRYRFDLSRGTWSGPDSVRGTRVRRDVNFRTIDKQNTTVSLNGEHLMGRITADWGLFYTDSRRYYISNRAEFRRNTVNLRVVNPYSDFTTFETFGTNLTINDPALLNSFNAFTDGDVEDNRGSNAVARLNLKLPYQMGEHKGFLKAGFKYRRMVNDQVRNNREYTFNGAQADVPFSRFQSDYQVSDFMLGNINYGPSLNANSVRDYFNANQNLFTFNESASLPVSATETYKSQEDVLATYVMSKIQLKKVSVLGGIRYENNVINYNANAVTIGNNNALVVTPITDEVRYGFILPNVHLKYALNEMTNIRAAWTYSYGRPNVSDLVPRANINILNGTLDRGNPNLQPAAATNLDLMVERYFQNIGIFSVGIFHKNINNFFFNQLLPNQTPAQIQQFYNLSVVDTLTVTTINNGERARVTGLEVNLQSNLDFLPGLLKGFGIFANYTYATSSATTAERDDIALQGQARHTANGSLAYDYKGFTVRFSVNYNGSFVNILSDNAERDIFQAARAQMDVSVQYQFKNHWRVFGEFVNINNAPQVQYQGERNRLMRVEYFGWWNRFGLAYTF